MRLLLLSPYYSPDLAPDAPLFEMLCTDLVRGGHKVSVVCAVPHYPTGRVQEQFRGRIVQKETQNGVDITRVWLPSVNRANLLQRLFAVICYQFLATLVGFRCEFDVLITVNPSFEKALPIFVLAVLKRKPMVFCVYDIYPDVGVRLGIFRHRAIADVIDAMEKFCYKRAAVVQVLSEGHRQTLLARGVPDSKLAVVRPWVDTDFIRPIIRQNEFSSEHGLNRFFVAMYAGNFGLTQGLEQLVETARLLANEQDIRFVLVGEGEAQVALQDSFRSAGLTNAQFVRSQPRDRLPNLLASADVALVMLRKGFGMDSVPSKTYSILASGRAIVAVVDKGSDTWQLVENANCGVCVSPGDSEALANAILRLYRERQHCFQLGANGRAYAVKWHSRGSAFREYDRFLSSMSGLKQMSVQEDNWRANASTSEVAIGQKPHDDQNL